jgi:hypothetical protein
MEARGALCMEPGTPCPGEEEGSMRLVLLITWFWCDCMQSLHLHLSAAAGIGLHAALILSVNLCLGCGAKQGSYCHWYPMPTYLHML